MAVLYDESRRLFKLDTANTTYMIGITEDGYVGHVYYGRRLNRPGGEYLLRAKEYAYILSVNAREKEAFLSSFPFEYPTQWTGDLREGALDVMNEEGQCGCELFYRDYEITAGKPSLEGLPASFAGEGKAAEGVSTLRLTLTDPVLEIDAELIYSVFEKEDVITRSVVIRNNSGKTRILQKVYSASIDMDAGHYEMLSLTGSWARERHIRRRPVGIGKQSVGSIAGKSSHQENPFIALVTPGAGQDTGEVYAMNFVYSGNFTAQVQVSQFDSLRMCMGINAENFSWTLESGDHFTAPEVVMTYSAQGLGQMTRHLHDFYRGHLIRSPYLHKERPILINNWEATYFDFDTEKILSIARKAKESGIEMLVLDDGWFGKRNSDTSSLGDWYVNENKIKGGIAALSDEIHKIGLKFGLWFEPEMISPDSDLYRAHPDWALQLKGRTATMSRQQYVLDLSRQEVRDYAYECVAKILRTAKIDYVKWDMNRELTDIGSAALPASRQQEVFHRYVLGVYEMQERLVTEFPDLLLENCSGGGARFDPGMLYYSPQIWRSDDMDPIERLRIQEGTALVYPLSCMGAHVCCAPNHTTARSVPFETRGHVALSGTFGYELDITQIPEEDLEMIPGQIAEYHRYHGLIAEGDYYRIHSWSGEEPWDVWGSVAKDRSEALYTFVQVLTRPNVRSRRILLPGLEEDTVYRLEGTEECYTGGELAKCGILIPEMRGDALTKLLHFTADTRA